MQAHGAEVVETASEATLLDGMFHVSGEIVRTTPFERGLPGHFTRASEGDAWEPDPLLLDERYLAIDVAGKGLVVLSACSHAGIVNVLTDARAIFRRRRSTRWPAAFICRVPTRRSFRRRSKRWALSTSQ